MDQKIDGHKYVRVKGRIKRNGLPDKRLFVHSDNNEHSPCIGLLKSTESAPLVRQEDADPHYYKIIFPTNRSDYGYISSNERYVEVVYKL